MKLLFTTLFLPTGLILLGLAVSLWWLLKSRRAAHRRAPAPRGALILLAVTLAGGYLLATPLVGRALGLMLFNAVQGRELASLSDADAIVVLTGGITQAGPLGWLPKPQSIQRVAAAYELQRRVNLRLPVIISGGHTEGVQAPSEAKVVADFFAHNRSEILPTELEETSTDTYESAMQLAPILTHRQAHNVLLVTSDVHMLRALAMYRARGVDAIPFPAMALPGHLGVRLFLPSLYGLSLSTDAMYEIYALAGSLLSGKISFADLTYTAPAKLKPASAPVPTQPQMRIILEDPATLPPPSDSGPGIRIDDPQPGAPDNN